MFLRQKLDEREMIKQKISELKANAYKFTEHQNAVLSQLLSLFDQLQSINLVLNKINNNSVIEIAGTKLNLNTAVELRNTMKKKVDVMSELIALDDGDLDVLALMQQRDTLLEEYYTMDSAISQADWNIKLEQ